MVSRQKRLLYSVYSIAFICGLAQCFEGLFLPEFKTRFHLNYTEQMYILFAKNIPFAFFSIAIGQATRQFGFKNSLGVALVLFAAGTWLLVPGLRQESFPAILCAFFIIGLGFNVQLVAGSPLFSMLGDPARSASRLNVGSALGAIAQIIAPLFVVSFIPDEARSVEAKLPYIADLFIVTGWVLLAMAFYTFLLRQGTENYGRVTAGADDRARSHPAIWRQPKIMLGVIAIFLVLGFEACLFGFYRNFLEDSKIAGLSAHQSQKMFTIYFAVFALGRVVGSYIQRSVRPVLTLRISLVIAMAILVVIILSRGSLAVAAITSVGFFVSIFFPTLFSIAIEGLSEEAGRASGLLTMGFLGGALLPVLQGKLADMAGLQLSFVMGFIPYLFALFYLWKTAADRNRQRSMTDERKGDHNLKIV